MCVPAKEVSVFESPIVLVRSRYEFNSVLVLFISLKQYAVGRCMYYTYIYMCVCVCVCVRACVCECVLCFYGKNLARLKLRKFQILIVICMKCENRSGVLQ